MKKLVVYLVFVVTGFNVLANEHKTKLIFETLVFNRHIWRGEQLGDAISVEPSLTISKGNFSFNLWAAQTINDSYAEIDLISSYRIKNFTFTFFDYYNPKVREENNYFSFKEGENRHSFELAINYSATPKIPFNLMLGTFVFGDNNPETGNPFYSTYIEATYPFQFLKLNIETTIGMTPFKGYYANEMAVVNSGLVITKYVRFNQDFLMPFIISGFYNPHTGKLFLNIALGIQIS